MSGAVFAAKGATTGQAATTSFFGAIPDRFNLLYPGHEDPVNTHITDTQLSAANNINQWTPYNTAYTSGPNAVTVTLGGFTTAPDGSSNAQKIVEAATTSQHYLTAYYYYSIGCPTSGPWRLAVFAKAAERTRCILRLNDFNGNTARTVFDLSGGQIGVACTITGTNGWKSIADTILPFGNGWYCCMMDITGSWNFGVMAYFELDAGSGTGAENSNYLGDITKGIYTWRSTFLPVQAWAMSGQKILFDDFNDNTMSEFDMADVGDPSKTWYIHGTYPYFFGSTILSNGQISVSGSQLHWGTVANASSGGINPIRWAGPTIGFSPVSDVWSNSTTYAAGKVLSYTPGGGFTSLYQSLINGNVGNQPDISPSAWSVYVSADNSIPGPGNIGTTGPVRTFKLNGTLIEARYQYQPHATTLVSGGMSVFLVSQSTIDRVQDISVNHGNVFAPVFTTGYYEVDHTEALNSARGPIPGGGHLVGSGSGLIQSIENTFVTAGYPVWNSTTSYAGTGFHVWFNNVLYTSIAGSNNAEPDLNPTKWAVVSNPPQVTDPPWSNIVQWDPSQMQTYQMLCLPVDSRSGTGFFLWFFNGLPAVAGLGGPGNGNFIYGPATTNNNSRDLTAPVWTPAEGLDFNLFVEGVQADFDFIAVTR